MYPNTKKEFGKRSKDSQPKVHPKLVVWPYLRARRQDSISQIFLSGDLIPRPIGSNRSEGSWQYLQWLPISPLGKRPKKLSRPKDC